MTNVYYLRLCFLLRSSLPLVEIIAKYDVLIVLCIVRGVYEQKSTVKSVRVEDWKAERAIIASIGAFLNTFISVCNI